MFGITVQVPCMQVHLRGWCTDTEVHNLQTKSWVIWHSVAVEEQMGQWMSCSVFMQTSAFTRCSVVEMPDAVISVFSFTAAGWCSGGFEAWVMAALAAVCRVMMFMQPIFCCYAALSGVCGFWSIALVVWGCVSMGSVFMNCDLGGQVKLAF